MNETYKQCGIKKNASTDTPEEDVDSAQSFSVLKDVLTSNIGKVVAF